MTSPRAPLLTLMVASLLGLAAAPAYAHQRADLAVTKPAEAAEVQGEAVDLVITATSDAALAESTFTITFDGKVVDNTGRFDADSVFTTFSLRSGASLTLRLEPVPIGPHELRIAYERDADNIKPDVVRRFTTVASTAVPEAPPASSGSSSEGSGGFPLPLLVIMGLAALGAGVAAVLVRRERPQSSA